MKIVRLAALAFVALATSCQTDADVASRNLSQEADNFGINRRIIFYNGITGEYILSIEGYCSIGNYDSGNRVSVTCKTGPNEYKKHFLGISDNVTFFAEQIEPAKVGVKRYKVVLRPSIVAPDVDVKSLTESSGE